MIFLEVKLLQSGKDLFSEKLKGAQSFVFGSVSKTGMKVEIPGPVELCVKMCVCIFPGEKLRPLESIRFTKRTRTPPLLLPLQKQRKTPQNRSATKSHWPGNELSSESKISSGTPWGRLLFSCAKRIKPRSYLWFFSPIQLSLFLDFLTL